MKFIFLFYKLEIEEKLNIMKSNELDVPIKRNNTIQVKKHNLKTTTHNLQEMRDFGMGCLR